MEVGQQWMVRGGFTVQIISEQSELRVDMLMLLLHSGLLQTKANTCNSTILLTVEDGKSKQAKAKFEDKVTRQVTKHFHSDLPDVDPCVGSTLDSVHRKLAPIKKKKNDPDHCLSMWGPTCPAPPA